MGLFRKITESGGTLAVELYLSMSKAQYNVAFGIAAVLLCMIMLINLIVDRMVSRMEGRPEPEDLQMHEWKSADRRCSTRGREYRWLPLRSERIN